MPSAYIRRMNKEMSDLKKSGSADVWFYPTEESLLNYEGFIIGPEGSPFERGMFNVNITIPNDYPFKPPKLVFTTKIFHPSIDFNTGFISMDILYDQWSPAITVPNILKLIRDFMACPIGDLFQNMEAKCLYHFDYPRYLEVAKYYTQEYA
ncbi:unnamed protein product [Moneuplotes crassus]|uniref:UBC core domain-containing protein n=1 Tax=Euplotes crassus TaxID=5936 RepID=A0AAD2D263_EUPCR|nr:unnamed protein product [Moneuplotes crassus]